MAVGFFFGETKMQLLNLETTTTMDSREIAELTGKEHGHVLRDIRAMLESLEVDQSNFGGVYLGGNGQERPCFKLPYDETVCLLTGYDAKARMAVIKRWKELEAQQVPKIPKTYAAALLEAGRLAEIVENQSVMIENQAHRLDESKKWASVKRMETSYGLTFKFSELKKYSIKHGYAMPKVRDANYAAGVNTYHEDVWMAVYQVDIPD
jgi:phage regulator Rha-like protein